MRFLIGLLALGIHWAALASMPTWRGVEVRKFAQSAAQPDLVYAVGIGMLFRSDDRGRTWNSLRIPQPVTIADLHVDPKDAQHLWVLASDRGSEGKPGLHESFDAGRQWVQRAPLKFSEPNGAAGGSFLPTRLVVPADGQTRDWWAYDGRWFRSSDSGRTWTRQRDGELASNAVQGHSFSYSLDDGVLWRSGDAERSWEQVHEFESPVRTGRRTGMPSNLIALNDDDLVVRNGQGNWLQSNDRGSSWTRASNGFQNLDPQRPDSADTGPAAPFGGETWCSVHRSPAVATMLLARCVWDNGSFPRSTCVHVSTDAGKSWTPPRTPGNRPDSGCMSPGLPGGWTSTALLLDAADPQRMLAAWQAGGLYRSDDGGASWQASDTGLMFRGARASETDWLAMGEPAIVQAVLYRDRELLLRTLASGVDINTPGNRFGGVLDADMAVRESESEGRRTLTPMMWPELRKLGATSFAVPQPDRRRLLTRALELKLNDIAEELIRQGYDWGAVATTASGPSEDAPEGELGELLSRGERFGLVPARVEQLISMYIEAARFPSADQTTLDLLNANRPTLAVKVLKASSRMVPFDLQRTQPRAPRLAIAAGLLSAGKKPWARRIFATIPKAAIEANTLAADEFIRAIGTDCDPTEGAWYRERGVPLKLAWSHPHCLSDKKYPASVRHRMLRAMDADGGIPPESWNLWLDDEDKAWLRKTAIYQRDLRDEKARGKGIVGIQLANDLASGELAVKGIIAGSSADEQGLRPGDVIRSVDGRSTRLQSHGQVIQRIIGQPGTWVSLGLLRAGLPMTVRLQRQLRP